MNDKIYILLASVFVGLIVVTSCQKDIDNEPEEIGYMSLTSDEFEILSQKLLNLDLHNQPDYSYTYPSYLRREGASLEVDDRDDWRRILLGRIMFYDKNLSKNGTVSCGSCHLQNLAFSDEESFSFGLNGEKTNRNSYALGSNHSNDEYYSDVDLKWDNSEDHLYRQILSAQLDHIEMGFQNEEEIKDRILELDYYEIIYGKLIPERRFENISALEIAQGYIGNFVLYMNSMNSKFDLAYKDSSINIDNFNPYQNIESFSSLENSGKNIYMDNCSGCHGRTFSILEKKEANNGLDIVYEDNGVGSLSTYENDMGKQGLFKVPLIRNIELTAPYMHDGRFQNLEEVIEHYSSGIKDHINLDESLPVGGFGYTEEEKAALVAFLKTTTDYQFINDERFSDPFQF